MPPGLTVESARLDVYHEATPGSDDPDRVIDSSALTEVSFDSRAQDVLDEATIAIDLRVADDTDPVRVGDRIVFVAALYSGSDNEPWGEGVWGEGRWGGGFIPIRWTGRVLPTTTTQDTPLEGHLEIEAADYVGAILSNRRITGAYVGEDAGAIIRDICEKKASEIDTSEIPDLGVSTDQFFRSKDCWDAVISLSALADCIIRQDGRKLLVDPIGELTYQFDLTDDDYYLPWETTADDDVKNVIRVDSGVNRKEEASQETQANWQRVTQDSRLTYRLRARKSRIHSIELYTRRVSDDSLSARLQADEGGAPVAIDDENSDIDATQWEEDNVDDEGWTAFFFDDHTLPDRDPWLIVETDGDEGHDVGVNDSGTPTYRSYYPHPLNFESSDTNSIQQYGARDLRISRENLDTLSAARDAVNAELARRAWPSKTISFTARSTRAHTLRPGTRVQVDKPAENATGEFIVTEVSRSFEAGAVAVETEITADWRKGILAP